MAPKRVEANEVCYSAVMSSCEKASEWWRPAVLSSFLVPKAVSRCLKAHQLVLVPVLNGQRALKSVSRPV